MTVQRKQITGRQTKAMSTTAEAAALLKHTVRLDECANADVSRRTAAAAHDTGHGMGMRSVFVTVGTTSHPRLVDRLSDTALIQELRSQGFGRLVVQSGNSPVPEQLVSCATSAGIHVEVFDFKNNIDHEIRAADLVIAHAGVGTAIEVLRCHKPLIVVVNENLMDNHQKELADALSDEEYLMSCYPDQLLQTLQKMPAAQFRSFPDPNENSFPALLDQILFPSSS